MKKNLLIGASGWVAAIALGTFILLGKKGEEIPEQRVQVGQTFELSAIGVTVEVTSTELWRMVNVKDSNGGEGYVEQDEFLRIVEELK